MEDTEFADRLASLRETRARLPEVVRNRHATRRRRAVAGHSARLLLIEADQPGAGLLATPGDAQGLADRGEFLRRLVLALAHPGVDGVIGTADVLDDLALLEVVERKLLVGSLNTGGTAGSPFVAGAFSGYDAETIVASHLDGGRLVVRIDPGDPRSATVVEASGRAVTELSGATTMALVAPLWCTRAGDDAHEDRSVESVRRAATIAAGLGARSGFTWLVLPAIEGLSAVTRAVTLPVLVHAEGEVADRLESWREALGAPGTRGIVLSGASLFPADGDVEGCVRAVADLVHGADDGRGARG
jgi:hypothetical protein